jgi:hypothetical protein
MQQNRNQGDTVQRVLTIVLVLLVALGWYNVVVFAINVEEAAINTYQEAQLEIVRNAGRAAKLYFETELEERGEEAVSEIEVEVLNNLVTPVRIGTTQVGDESTNVGDAWIYAPDHVIFDPSTDFPDIYAGKSMAQIFEIQKDSGAFHYEAMSEAVGNAEGGQGWYVWDPAKASEAAPWWEFLTQDSGREIAAWWPVEIEGHEDLEWVVGMSAMLPYIMRATGGYDQINRAVIQMLIVTALVAALLVALNRSQAQVQELRAQVAELRIEIDETKKAQQVSEIVDSEYFQSLEARAKEMRERKRKSGGG